MKKLTLEKERELLSQCLEYNKCDQLVRQYWNLVYHTVHRTLKKKQLSYTEQDVENLHSDIFTLLWEKDRKRLRMFSINKGMSLAGWINLISIRTVLNSIRQNQKRWGDSLSGQKDKVCFEDFMKTSKGEASQIEEKLFMEKALKYLQPLDMIIIKFAYMHDLSSKDIASILNLKEETVNTKKFRAKEKLKEIIKDLAK